ncbi:MAG: hypothetical protein HUJ54_06220 [Erysipelotrichaceae bacterium]|nr:hypothetical protein [Erysipelotrichaceae bacterium]
MNYVYRSNPDLKQTIRHQKWCENPFYLTRKERKRVLIGLYRVGMFFLILLILSLCAALHQEPSSVRTGMMSASAYCLFIFCAALYGVHMKRCSISCSRFPDVYNATLELKRVHGTGYLYYSFSFDPDQPVSDPQCTIECPLPSIRQLYLDPAKMQLSIDGDLRMERSYNGMRFSDEMSSMNIPMYFDENMEILERLVQTTGLSYQEKTQSA